MTHGQRRPPFELEEAKGKKEKSNLKSKKAKARHPRMSELGLVSIDGGREHMQEGKGGLLPKALFSAQMEPASD